MQMEMQVEGLSAGEVNVLLWLCVGYKVSSLGPKVWESWLLSWKCESERLLRVESCSVGFSALFYWGRGRGEDLAG
jgi:hypothetical protein